MIKEFKFDDDARQSLLKGMETVAKAVGSTLGPKGKSVIIDDYTGNGKPYITKDGVTVAKNIGLENKYENIGAILLQQAALNTVSDVGDGTTTSTVLAYHLVNEANSVLPYIKNINEFKKGIEYAKNVTLNHIRGNSNAIGKNDIKTVATISANNDHDIGVIVAEAFNSVGTDGVITVEESNTRYSYVDVIEGMQFEPGYVSHWFATDKESGNCFLENPCILVTDEKIELTRDILPIAKYCIAERRPLLIIARDYDDEVLQNMKINHVQGNLKSCLVKTPLYGNYREEFLEDICILTGAKIATYDNGISVSSITPDMLGSCTNVLVTKDNTTIVGGGGRKELVADRITEIKDQLEEANKEDTFLTDFYKNRIAKLSSGVARIKVGGTSELDMKERKDRIDDAVCAVRAALEDGLVDGGGFTYVKAARLLEQFIGTTSPKDDYKYGIMVVVEGLISIAHLIIYNAGYEDKLKEIDDLPESNKDSYWIDASNGTIINYHAPGVTILDPTKVVIQALINAISVLDLFLSTNCLIVEKDIFKQI